MGAGLLIKRLCVRDFGPIASGCLELGDLTVIAGQQNSGKTYLAMLLYAIAKSYGILLHSSISAVLNAIRERGAKGYIPHETVAKIVDEELSKIKKYAERGIKSMLVQHFRRMLLESFLVSSLGDLVRRGSSRATVEVEYDWEGGTVAEMSFDIVGDNLEVTSLSLSEDYLPKLVRESGLEVTIYEKGVSATWRFHEFLGEPLYIPVERLIVIPAFMRYLSLFITFYRTLTWERAERSIERPGLGLRAPLLDYMNAVAQALGQNPEGPVLDRGSFVVKEGRIWYIDEYKVEVPIESASSGAAQLIGILLPIAVKRPGVEYNPLIIEEPELNLHADLHLGVAGMLAGLTRQARVVVTTHSHYLLASLGHRYRRGEIGTLKAYFLDRDEGTIEELAVGIEIETPRSIKRALSRLAEEALKTVEDTA